MIKKLMVLVVILVPALVLGGCCSAREAAFADGVDQYANKSGLLAEYDRYVENDPNLSSDTKKIRKGTSEGLRMLIEEEKRALEE